MSEINDQINKKIEEVKSYFDELFNEVEKINQSNSDIDEIKELIVSYRHKIENLTFSDSKKKNKLSFSL